MIISQVSYRTNGPLVFYMFVVLQGGSNGYPQSYLCFGAKLKEMDTPVNPIFTI